MSRSAAKRPIEELDEDPDDETYGAVSKRPRKVGHSKPPRTTSKKRRRGGYGRESGAVTSDDDDIEDDESEESESDLPTSPIMDTTETGRPRRSANKEVKYEDPDSDEIDEDEDEVRRSGERAKARLSQRPSTRPSRVVKLKVNPVKLQAAGRGRAGSKRTSPREASTGRTRRSSRISHSEEQPLVSLTDSGKHERIERPGSSEPDGPAHPIRSGKRVPTTSTVIEASQEDSGASKPGDEEEDMKRGIETGKDELLSGMQAEAQGLGDVGEVPESVHSGPIGEESDGEDDHGPVPGRTRASRKSAIENIEPFTAPTRHSKAPEEGSDFDPGEEEEAEDDEISRSPRSKSPHKESQRSEASSLGRRSGRIAAKRAAVDNSDSDELDPDELAEEAADLRKTTRGSRRKRKRSIDITEEANILYDAPNKRRTRGDRRDYTIRPEMWATGEDDDQVNQPVVTRRGGGDGKYRSLWETRGPFGLAGGPPPAAGRAGGVAAGGADSDSSDDEALPKPAPRGVGGAVGMTPTSAIPPSLFPQALNPDPAQGAGGGPANLGKIKDRKALADADPLGVDQNVNFDGVGGLDSHINQLKEMVMLPLLYPEVFQQFNITPPRGVLFHGPPGTGKTLLARALANNVSSHGKKVTFYMRKGADALSKWVGEAEKQLRLLFEEARKNQPSIIFFDEIDGLAPVRSSKQEQIHASIVATLLALMDGMDGRGQVIVIGATNRPDTVDSALRRPGRFDREFYFPLPNEEARRKIIDIHTKGWDPPLSAPFKDQLASLTKGYGGADLRALCTEAALNAVQGTYPQIYQSTEKLVIDPTKIKVLAKDFMISVNKMIPSSERSNASSAAPLNPSIEPLLRDAFQRISAVLDDILPERKKLSALEEAEYDDRDNEAGFERERVQQDFDRARIFRPRMLVYGVQGVGQQYIGQALLNKFERLHVQSFDLSVLYSDTTRSAEAAVVQLFNEARRHKPSVIYIPNIHFWYETVGQPVLKLFTGLLRSLPPNEPVLVLGIMELENPSSGPDPGLIRDLFGYSKESHIYLERPNDHQRREYFQQLSSLIRAAPTSFPDLVQRKKRVIEKLDVALPATPQKSSDKEQLKTYKKNDRNTLNLLKIKLAPIMDQLKRAYKSFRKPPVDPSLFQYLYDEQDPDMINTDLPQEQRQLEQYRPYELDTDEKGGPVIREVATGKFYYNLELITIERRLSNGYYKRYKDFVEDVKRLNKDSKTHGDPERILKANEMLANVEVDTNYLFEMQEPNLVAECERVYQRELERARLEAEKARPADHNTENVPLLNSNVPLHTSGTTAESSGPVTLGQVVPGQSSVPQRQPQLASATPMSNGISHSSQLDSNGPLVEDEENEDVHMSNGDGQGDSQKLDNSSQVAPAARDTQAIRSQKSALTPMAQNSQAEDYHNSASTTTSGQKTSDKSRSSGANTQSTNGVGKGDHPDFSVAQQLSGASELPDTQEMNYSNSQSHSSPRASQPSQPSQASPQDPAAQTQSASNMPPPLSRTGNTSIASLLNNPDESAAALIQPQPTLIVDQKHLDKFHEELVYRSSGLSVEQLEQLNAALMDTVWKQRGEWNRNILVHSCERTFNKVVKEIEDMQRILPYSQSSGES